MKNRVFLRLAFSCAVVQGMGSFAALAAEPPARGCAALPGLRLPDVRVTEAIAVPAPAAREVTIKVAHCVSSWAGAAAT